MNGKAAKLLRKMHRGDKKSKRLFQTLNHIQKGKLRAMCVWGKYVDHLKAFE